MSIRTRLEGMGALIGEGFVGFRVWAPHAKSVSVVGSFNEWKDDRHPLDPEEGGCWYGEIEGAKAGDTYKFSLETEDGQRWNKNDPYSRELDLDGNSVVHDPQFDWEDDGFSLPAFNELLIYELHVATFHPAGNLAKVIQRLDYLQKLNVNVIQLMPVTPHAGEESWGYTPTHLLAVDPRYGSPAELKTLIKECHKRGMGVVLDVVFNHMGPDQLDMWRFDGWCENDLGGIWYYNDKRAETPWGHTRLDYGRPEVRSLIKESVRTWLHEYRFDGLRWDGTKYIRRLCDTSADEDLADGWSIMAECNAEAPAGKLLIGEDLGNMAEITRPVEEGGLGFHAQWELSFVYPVREVITAHEDGNRNLNMIADAVTHTFDGDPFRRVIYTESHDEVANGKSRVPTEIDPNNPDSQYAVRRSIQGAVLTMTAPGIPMLFQGQEFLEEGWLRNEAPLDWERCSDNRGVLKTYRRLIQLRRNWENNTRGLCGRGLEVLRNDDKAKVIAFRRWDEGGPGDETVVVLNLSHVNRDVFRVGFPAPGVWKVRFSQNAEGTVDPEVVDVQVEEQEWDGRPYSAELTLEPYSALILSQDRPE